MQKYVKKVIDQVISWAVPVICAASLLLWDKIPPEAQHYWPVLCIGVIGVYSLVVAMQDRRDIKLHMQMHTERKAVDDNALKAFCAILDAEMGSLYATCVARRYTTEDERRLYDRLNSAYEAVGGNGEAKRRKTHFEAIPYEEEWVARHSDHESGKEE